MPSSAQRKQLVKQNGVTSESLFYHPYDLCGFDSTYDLVIDVMHAIELNLIKSELKLMSEPGLKQDCPVHTRSPKYVWWCIESEDLDKALGQVQWTTELTDYMRSVARVRSVIAKLILGGVKYWTPCDCQRSYLQDALFFVWTS